MKVGLVSKVLANEGMKAKNSVRGKVHPATSSRVVGGAETSELVAMTEGLDLVLFSGWTLNPQEYRAFVKHNANSHSLLVMQENGTGYPPWHIVEGRHERRNVSGPIIQRFKDSTGSKEDLRKLLQDLDANRRIEVDGKTARLIICGENNLLRNKQSEGNAVSVRIEELAQDFERIREDTDIFLNPAHTPMGNLGKLKQRWRYLSEGGRLCVYATNALDASQLGGKRLQYAFADGEELELLPFESVPNDSWFHLSVVDWS